MTTDALIMIGPDGMIHATSGAVPDGVLDRPLASCTSLPPAVRDAGGDLLRRLRDAPGRVATTTLVEGHLTFHLVAHYGIAVRRRPANLRELLPSKLAVLASQADSAGVRLTIDVADEVPLVVLVDAEKLSWAVTTLVGNALRYVQAPSRKLRGSAIGVRAIFDRSAGVVAIVIADDGPGIPADTVRRLFAGEGLNVRGSGLSLLMVRDVVAALGGTVEVRSRTDEADHGTTIELSFPA
jgi:signal transduction histidine kinase